jgi:hypothetical protein
LKNQVAERCQRNPDMYRSLRVVHGYLIDGRRSRREQPDRSLHELTPDGNGGKPNRGEYREVPKLTAARNTVGGQNSGSSVADKP